MFVLLSMALPVVLPTAGPMTRVSLSFSLANLPDLDITSKTDAMVVVSMSTSNGAPVKIGQTEKAKDNLNPRFATPVVVDYCFETVQKLSIWVGDIDNHGVDHIGDFSCTLGDIVGARGQQLTTNLKMAQMSYRQAQITIRAEEVHGANMTVFFQFAGSHLDSTPSFRLCLAVFYENSR